MFIFTTWYFIIFSFFTNLFSILSNNFSWTITTLVRIVFVYIYFTWTDRTVRFSTCFFYGGSFSITIHLTSLLRITLSISIYNGVWRISRRNKCFWTFRKATKIHSFFFTDTIFTLTFFFCFWVPFLGNTEVFSPPYFQNSITTCNFFRIIIITFCPTFWFWMHISTRTNRYGLIPTFSIICYSTSLGNTCMFRFLIDNSTRLYFKLIRTTLTIRSTTVCIFFFSILYSITTRWFRTSHCLGQR